MPPRGGTGDPTLRIPIAERARTGKIAIGGECGPCLCHLAGQVVVEVDCPPHRRTRELGNEDPSALAAHGYHVAATPEQRLCASPGFGRQPGAYGYVDVRAVHED
ncbi:hypothetical protein OG936_34800 [Streptomyces sp. NBC_00846]|uniref:hypothetical protein n=1 Tax=Streptomyces sp. NBC_00846 TaxID=2975849 RepID=UPI003863D571|nr:hypothetical protein OG936_34800 [Streptomyces sp. NBC_00846]